LVALPAVSREITRSAAVSCCALMESVTPGMAEVTSFV
jgi:hypothetical protein